MYTSPRCEAKKELKNLVQQGRQVQIDPQGLERIEGDVAFIEGPAYPKPHRWYAKVRINPSTGKILEVLS
jgi:hypothetical protein